VNNKKYILVYELKQIWELLRCLFSKKRNSLDPTLVVLQEKKAVLLFDDFLLAVIGVKVAMLHLNICTETAQTHFFFQKQYLN
jgi:hypothetical protein